MCGGGDPKCEEVSVEMDCPATGGTIQSGEISLLYLPAVCWSLTLDVSVLVLRKSLNLLPSPRVVPELRLGS